jgi:hypothetical protein
MPQQPDIEHQTERTAHAIYGLVIITASLVADLELSADALTSLTILWGAGLVLAVAHIYSSLVAEIAEKGRFLTLSERELLLGDNLPVLAALIAPTALLLGAAAGVIDLSLAIDLSIAVSVGLLFLVGAHEVRQRGARPSVQIGIGLVGIVVGVAVIALEVNLGH